MLAALVINGEVPSVRCDLSCCDFMGCVDAGCMCACVQACVGGAELVQAADGAGTCQVRIMQVQVQVAARPLLHSYCCQHEDVNSKITHWAAACVWTVPAKCDKLCRSRIYWCVAFCVLSMPC
jgi:hypothetical protein